MKIFFLPFDIGFLLVDTPLLDQGGEKPRGWDEFSLPKLPYMKPATRQRVGGKLSLLRKIYGSASLEHWQ